LFGEVVVDDDDIEFAGLELHLIVGFYGHSHGVDHVHEGDVFVVGGGIGGGKIGGEVDDVGIGVVLSDLPVGWLIDCVIGSSDFGFVVGLEHVDKSDQVDDVGVGVVPVLDLGLVGRRVELVDDGGGGAGDRDGGGGGRGERRQGEEQGEGEEETRHLI